MITMKTEKTIITNAAALRRKAEEQLAALPPNIPRSDHDAERLLHELQVHQIELELQNEELQRSHHALELLLEQYTTLYDFAPVGYLSLDRKGQILKINLAGSSLIGVTRSRFNRQPFVHFVDKEDRLMFADYLENVFHEHSGRKSCELKLFKEGRATIIVQMEALASGSGQECLVALTDVTRLRLVAPKS